MCRAAGVALAMGAWLALGLVPGDGRGARAAEITERVVVDPTSGIAIFGYDPVGYFLEGRPVPGRQEHEWVWHNAVWRFASGANMEEFKRTPDSFAPAYGGYDADAVARGVASFPDPTCFAIVDDRLFLFRSEEAKQRVLRDGDIPVADRAWPGLSASLRP